MNELIQEAKKDRRKFTARHISNEVVELAVAWANDEVTLKGVLNAMKLDNTRYPTAYSILARALKKHMKKNQL